MIVCHLSNDNKIITIADEFVPFMRDQEVINAIMQLSAILRQKYERAGKP